MKTFLRKSNLLKAGVAVAVLAISAINFSQANNKSILTVSDAEASTMNCKSQANSKCTGYTSDGLYHEVTNAEN